MRILLYGLNYSPELTGIGKYTGEMASWLAARGHSVRVVAAPPYYPAWKIREDYRNTLYRTEHAPGEPTVFRTPLYVPEHPTGLRRMAHLFSFMVASLPVMLRQIGWSPELVFTVEPAFFGAPLALTVAKLSGAPCWLHIQDFEVDAAFELGILPSGGSLQRWAHSLEKRFTTSFDVVSTISSKMLERALSKGVSSSRAVLFPNWVDVSEIYPCSAPNQMRRDMGLEGKTVLLYSGNMGQKQGLEVFEPLTRAFLNDPRVHFLFCGNGTFREELEQMTAGRPNVTLLPLQPLDRLNELLNVADIHLLPQRARAADLVMPSKLVGILASGRPVIAAAERGTQLDLVVRGAPEMGVDPCGLVVPPEDHGALQQAVLRLVADSNLREELGSAARRYAIQHLCKEQVLLRFEQQLLELVLSLQPLKQPSPSIV